MSDIEELRQDIKNQLCIDGHLNIAHSSIMRSDSPDGNFCIIGSLARHAVDMSFDAMLDHIKRQEALIAELRKDAERFVFEHTEFQAMLEIEYKNITTGGNKDVNWWREEIDSARLSDTSTQEET